MREVPLQRNREVKKSEQTVSTDIGEEKIVVSSSSFFDVNQYLKYENDKQQPLFYHVFSVMYTVGFFFSNKYDATESHPWGGKGDIILKL